MSAAMEKRVAGRLLPADLPMRTAPINASDVNVDRFWSYVDKKSRAAKETQ